MSTKKVLNYPFLLPLPFPNLSWLFFNPEEEEEFYPQNETLLGLFLALHSRIFGCPETLLSLDEIKCISYLHFSLVKLSN